MKSRWILILFKYVAKRLRINLLILIKIVYQNRFFVLNKDKNVNSTYTKIRKSNSIDIILTSCHPLFFFFRKKQKCLHYGDCIEKNYITILYHIKNSFTHMWTKRGQRTHIDVQMYMSSKCIWVLNTCINV